MTKDARISTALPGHPKTKKLLKRLGHAGPLACVYLFIWAAANRSDGDLSGMSNEDIELSVDWTGDDGAFVQAMMDVGFLDGQENELVIHDWKEHNPWAAGAKDRSDSSKWAALCKRYGRETAAKRMPDYAERMRPAREPDAEAMRNECKPDAPSPSPLPSQNTPLPPKGKEVELKDFLFKNIPEDLMFLQNNLLEFFKYRQQKPKSKRYQSEIGINGLFRDICNCIAVGHPPVECLNIAMERGWQTPSPDYFKPEMFTKLTNGTVQETKEQILKRHGLSA